MGLTGKKGRKPSYFRRLAQTSLILSGLGALQEKLFRFPGAGCGGTAAKRPDRLLKSGFFGSLVPSSAAKSTAALKMRFAAGVESSRAVRLYRAFVDVLLSMSMQTAAVFFITFGLYSVFVAVAKSYTGPAPVPLSDVLPGALCVVAGLPFVGCVEPVSAKLRGSGIYTLVFVNLLGVEGTASGRPARPKTYGAAAVIAGTLLGTLSFVVPAGRIIFYAFLVLLCMVILHSPESGLLLVLLTFPFTGAASSFFILAAFISYFQKLARGKRNFRFGVPDIFFLLFAAATLLLVLFGAGGATHLRLCFSSVFLLCANLLRSNKLVKKASACFAVGLSAYAALCCLHGWASFIGYLSGDAAGFVRSLPQPSVSPALLLMLLPVCLMLVSTARTRLSGVCGVVLLAMDVCALIYTRSNVIWYSALFTAFAFFALVYGKRLLTSLLGIGVLSLAAVGFGELSVRLGYADNGFAVFSALPRGAELAGALTTGYGGGLSRVFGTLYPDFNGWFRLSAEGGLIYPLLALITVSVTAARAFLLPESREGGARAGLSAGCGICVLIAFALAGVFTDVFSDLQAQLAFWASAGMLYAVSGNAWASYVPRDAEAY